MKRRANNIDREEQKLSKLLFNNPEEFARKIKPSDDLHSEHKEVCPAWTDDDDDQFTADKLSDTKNKDLYTNTLKQKYVNLVGTPNWAKLDKPEGESDDNDELLRKVGHLQNRPKLALPKGFLEVKKYPKINSETGNEGPIISCVEFHPTSSVALVAGQSQKVSLYSIGGETSNKLHSFSLHRANVLCAHFSPDGMQAYLAIKSDHSYCVYDLIKAKAETVKFPRIVKSPSFLELSPDGKYLVTSDGHDEAFLISTKSKELMKILKHNNNVIAATFNNTSDKLYTLSVTGEVYIWNLTTHRVEHKFFDEGCVSASRITTSSCGRLMAIGSNEGIVNIYESSNLNTTHPTPTKTIQNLKTQITNLKFNCSTELLAISSSYYPNAIKMVHLPSYHVYQNIPDPGTNLHTINTVSFSPNSGFFALGNNRSSAMLYRLKYFKNY